MIFGQKKRGFTLVEMLIVIVIIGVLAAALIPRLTSVRGRANDVARKADIQQLATAVITYQMDSNGKLPVPTVATGRSVDFISDSLITAGMDGVPQDPLADTSFNFNNDATSGVVTDGSYGYLRIFKDGIANAGFVLMAKTQTAGGSNWVIKEDYSTGTITTASSTENLTPCKTVDKAATSGDVVSAPGGACKYYSASELRYIMVR